MNITVCPNCRQKRNTVKYDERLGKELWHCENCDSFYDVFYDVSVREIKLKTQ